jgi:hypothetical protein
VSSRTYSDRVMRFRKAVYGKRPDLIENDGNRASAISSTAILPTSSIRSA